MGTNTFLLHLATTIMQVKLSSSGVIFAAFLAMCVPSGPIALLVPSPVIAMTCLSGKTSIFPSTFGLRHLPLSLDH